MNLDEIKQALSERVEELARQLFPGGKRDGNHWCVGDVSGQPGKSFKICIAGPKVGLWGDFAEALGHHHCTLIDLWMKVRGEDFKTAVQQCANWHGGSFEYWPETKGQEVFPSQHDEQVAHPPWQPYALTQLERQQCDSMRDALRNDERTLCRIAKSRGWDISTIRELVSGGCLGLHEGKLAYLTLKQSVDPPHTAVSPVNAWTVR